MAKEHRQQIKHAMAGNPSGDYEYTARYYDRFYASLAPQDIEFYRELAQDAVGPVLELGCGTGRVSLPLARDGHSVTGLDCSPAMLMQLRAKLEAEPAEVRERVTIAAGSMVEFNLGQQFALIIVPFRAFQHLLTVAEQRSCLAAVLRHLALGGRFVFNAFNPNPEYIASALRAGQVWHTDADWRDDEAGLRITRAHRLHYETLDQFLSVSWRFEEFQDGVLTGTCIEDMRLRWLYRYEAEHLLELCGFKLVAAYGDYRKTPLQQGANELIFVCERARTARA